MINVREDSQYLSVSGTYNEMQEYLSKLKRLGFRYNGSTREWQIPVSKATPALREKLDAALGRSQVQLEKRQKQLEDLFDKALNKPLMAIKFTKTPSGTLQLAGPTKPLYDECKKAGGAWFQGAWLFAPGDVKPDAFEDLLTAVEKLSHRYSVQISQIKDFLSEPKQWPTLGVKLHLDSTEKVVVIDGNTKAVHVTIKYEVPGVKFQGSSWTVPRIETNRAELESLAKAFDKLEAKAEEEKAAQAARPAPEPEKRTNAKPDYCRVCKGLVPAGKGYLYKVYDPYLAQDRGLEDDMVWVVEHKDKRDCEAVQEEQRIRSELARNKQQARNNLRELAEKRTNYAEKADRYPSGENIMIDDRGYGYGGGTTVVIEPGDRYFWYIVGNGADGDDWSHNNLPGAIGYRLELTPEARVLIDAAKK